MGSKGFLKKELATYTEVTDGKAKVNYIRFILDFLVVIFLVISLVIIALISIAALFFEVKNTADILIYPIYVVLATVVLAGIMAIGDQNYLTDPIEEEKAKAVKVSTEDISSGITFFGLILGSVVMFIVYSIIAYFSETAAIIVVAFLLLGAVPEVFFSLLALYVIICIISFIFA